MTFAFALLAFFAALASQCDAFDLETTCKGKTVPLYRYWNPGLTDHFYTTNYDEQGPGRNGWNSEGIAAYVYPTKVEGTTALYRYWNGAAGDHLYTTDWNERGAGSLGWGFEKIEGYVYTDPKTVEYGAIPLHRYWNGGLGDHLYTTNYNERGGGSLGWAYEKVEAYVCPTPAAVPPPDLVGEAGNTGSGSGSGSNLVNGGPIVPKRKFASYPGFDITPGVQFSEQVLPTVDKCSAACGRLRKCVAFVYYSDTNECFLKDHVAEFEPTDDDSVIAGVPADAQIVQDK